MRDQLWAEAAVRVARGEKFYPQTEAERDAFEREVDKRRVVDSLEDKIYSWLDRPVGYTAGQPVTTAWLLENVAGIENPRRGDDARMNATLRKIGFTRVVGAARYWHLPQHYQQQIAQQTPPTIGANNVIQLPKRATNA